MAVAFKVLLQYLDLNDIASLRHFLDCNSFQVDERDENGATLLHHCAGRGVTEFVKELVLRGADIQAEDLDNWTALLCAAKAGHLEIVQYLIDHGADIEHRDMGGWTPLMWASYKGYIDIVNLLLDKKADVHIHGNYHLSPLLWGAGRGHYDVVVALINKGAKVNSADKYGTTALIWACRKGCADIVDFLLKSGANVDTAGMYSWTPLLVAVSGGHQECVSLLLEKKPNVNALDKEGMTALAIACREGLHEIVSSLIAVGAYINIQDRSGDTPLIHAVKGNHKSVVEILLKKHADIDIQGKDRKTALYYAVEKGSVQIVKLLLAQNPDLEAETKDGDTALLRAVRNRNLEMVILLLEKRAKVGATDKRGDNCLHIAMRARSKTIVEALLRNPKNSQLLYRANKAGETPYGIDKLHQKTILGQVFVARHLDTDDAESMLGYELYSSALADILSEPTLTTPVTIGLYAKFGSGKNFLLHKVRDEMRNFAEQWAEPPIRISFVLFITILHIAAFFGVLTGMLTSTFKYGLITFVGIIIVVYAFLFTLKLINKRYHFDWIDAMFHGLSKQMGKLKLIMQIAFFYPPNISSDVHTMPVRFHFAEVSNGPQKGEQAIGLMMASMLDAIESHYGSISTRLYRALRPKHHESITKWKLRRMCCIPIIFIFELILFSMVTGICLIIIIYTHNLEPVLKDTLLIILYITTAVLLAALVANFRVITKLITSLCISQSSRLKRLIRSTNDALSLTVLGTEINMMTDMIKCLDSFQLQQSRLVAVVDVLEFYDFEKVLNILSVIQSVLTTPGRPFIILISVDPHIITKAAEARSKRMVTEVGTIGGHDFLRNLVQLPVYLQSSNLKKAQKAQMTAALMNRDFSERRLSNASELGMSQERLRSFTGTSRTGSKKVRPPPDSVGSSIGSNLHKLGGHNSISGAALDKTRIMLSDDFFSDVNPRSMRRLLNVLSLTIRLLKAFQIEFSWYRLCSWINLTEQWPLRANMILIESEKEDYEDTSSLQTIYERCKPKIAYLKEAALFLEMDRDERKLDAFLHLHKNDLVVSDLKVFLPFTLNLDPYLKKILKEDQQMFEDEFEPITMNTDRLRTGKVNQPAPNRMIYPFLNNVMPTPLQPLPNGPIGFNYGNARPPVHHDLLAGLINPPALKMSDAKQQNDRPDLIIEKDMQNILLTKLSTQELIELLTNMPDMVSIMPRLAPALEENAITGRVLMHCDLTELKNVLNISFGHWETFKLVVNALRSHALSRFPMPVPELHPNISGDRDSTDAALPPPKPRNVPSRFQRQVTIEEEMICETLQLLNNDEERDELADRITGLQEDPLSPIHETSIEQPEPLRRKSTLRNVALDYDPDSIPTIITIPATVNPAKSEKDE